MSTFITIPLYETIKESDIVSEMYVYLPHRKHHPAKAIVICGGGGFNKVNLEHEGCLFAQWLNTIGVVGIVLNYRLPNEDKRIPEADLRQAIKVVREKSQEWNIDRHSIGAAGFSIGGHAVTLLAVKEAVESKLDFTMLFYSVVSMTYDLTHKPSRDKLLGVIPNKEDIYCYSSENYISGHTPKSLIMSSGDDSVVSPLNGILYYEGLKKYDIPSALYIFPSGGHGWGMNKEFLYHKEMCTLVEKWLTLL